MKYYSLYLIKDGHKIASTFLKAWTSKIQQNTTCLGKFQCYIIISIYIRWDNLYWQGCKFYSLIWGVFCILNYVKHFTLMPNSVGN